ncbi:unnamed protein product, partial [Ectocarpus sp. 4 AP-2014]
MSSPQNILDEIRGVDRACERGCHALVRVVDRYTPGVEVSARRHTKCRSQSRSCLRLPMVAAQELCLPTAGCGWNRLRRRSRHRESRSRGLHRPHTRPCSFLPSVENTKRQG